MQTLKKLVVAAEFAGAYLWIKDASDKTRRVGTAIGTTRYAISAEYGISPALEADFRSWVEKWEATVLPRVEYVDIAPKSFWDEIHQTGMDLALRLKAEVGNRFEVEYESPRGEPRIKL